MSKELDNQKALISLSIRVAALENALVKSGVLKKEDVSSEAKESVLAALQTLKNKGLVEEGEVNVVVKKINNSD